MTRMATGKKALTNYCYLGNGSCSFCTKNFSKKFYPFENKKIII